MLHKWSLHLRKQDEEQSFPLRKWISALLLSSVEGSVDRKLIVECEGENDSEALLVCNPLIQMSSIRAHTLLSYGSSLAICPSPLPSAGKHDTIPPAQ